MQDQNVVHKIHGLRRRSSITLTLNLALTVYLTLNLTLTLILTLTFPYPNPDPYPFDTPGGTRSARVSVINLGFCIANYEIL
jgi:hypothetical protein